jgi:hypothetical protein
MKFRCDKCKCLVELRPDGEKLDHRYLPKGWSDVVGITSNGSTIFKRTNEGHRNIMICEKCTFSLVRWFQGD